jgi:hypothetical protein
MDLGLSSRQRKLFLLITDTNPKTRFFGDGFDFEACEGALKTLKRRLWRLLKVFGLYQKSSNRNKIWI